METCIIHVLIAKEKTNEYPYKCVSVSVFLYSLTNMVWILACMYSLCNMSVFYPLCRMYQRKTCRTFNNGTMISRTVLHFASEVYPPELTKGFDTPIVAGEAALVSKKKRTSQTINSSSHAHVNDCNSSHVQQMIPQHTYESLRNMEMLVVARVLSRPEPPPSQRDGGFYVSKAWCRQALRWLDVQAERRRERETHKIQLDTTSTFTKEGNNNNNQNHNHNYNQNHNHNHNHHSKKKKKMSKKQERMKNRKQKSHAVLNPPPPNVNQDITCAHGHLVCSTNIHNSHNNNNYHQYSHHVPTSSPSSFSPTTSRARRRVMDKQAWKILKKLYPESVPLAAMRGECVHCALEASAAKKDEEARRQKDNEERKKPLSCPIVRNIYTRHRGVPHHCLRHHKTTDVPTDKNLIHPNHISTRNSNNSINNHQHPWTSPLLPGVYHVLPRSWCHRWRKYLKNGEGGRPPAPEASALLCDAHRLPLIPPHLEQYLYGETPGLFEVITYPHPPHTNNTMTMTEHTLSTPPLTRTLGRQLNQQNQQPQQQLQELIDTLRAAGLSNAEIQEQRLAMLRMEQQHQLHTPPSISSSSSSHPNDMDHHSTPEERRARINAQLDKENSVVVEILTDEEMTALQKWWPDIHSSYALKFAVVSEEVDYVQQQQNHHYYCKGDYDNMLKMQPNETEWKELGGSMMENSHGDISHGDSFIKSVDLSNNCRTDTNIVWTTAPCRECDGSGMANLHNCVVRNRCRSWASAQPKKQTPSKR